MSAGADIAAEIAAALAEAGAETGDGALIVTVEEPGATTGPDDNGTATLHSVTAIDDRIQRRDGNGTVTETVRVLTIDAVTVEPQKGWRVQIGGVWHRIATVMPLAPGGVALLYDVELEG